jgi:homeobox protein ESX1
LATALPPAPPVAEAVTMTLSAVLLEALADDVAVPPLPPPPGVLLKGALLPAPPAPPVELALAVAGPATTTVPEAVAEAAPPVPPDPPLPAEPLPPLPPAPPVAVAVFDASELVALAVALPPVPPVPPVVPEVPVVPVEPVSLSVAAQTGDAATSSVRATTKSPRQGRRKKYAASRLVARGSDRE